MVVRNPFKGSSPVTVATYITNDHTTASISFFLGSFLTDVIRLHGRGAKQRPVMLICDGSTVLMQSMAYNFCGVSLQELLSSAAKYYHLAMHVFGLMTQATTMSELDEVVTSAVVVFSSSHSDRNVGKHFENLQGLLTNSAQSNLDDSTIVEDCVTHRVDMERWKQRKQNRRGVYVTPINKPFVFRQYKKNLMQKTKHQKLQHHYKNKRQDPKDKARQGQSSSTTEMTEHAEDAAQGGNVDASSEYINAEESTVYLALPARNSAEQAEADNAVKKIWY
ncbi:hypothetical protein KUCAC02_003438 [Chaenocephalus aceratus]|uniref:Uncharacterized protein n=1 Tax=Chaenocephalus aceratus TaxID=36190 RepID=A0ACB9WKL3_CHAAC|nr:hypothetical protein KUCAC02_003438 [Chaenocephalus aceratus]